MSNNPLLNAVSAETGLTQEQLKPGNPLISAVQRESGTYLNPGKGRQYGFDGLDIAAGTVRLTNTYTDPLESYTSYGVARNAFIDWNDTRAQNQTWGEQLGYGLTKAGITAVGALAENTVGVVGGLLNLAFGENHSYYDNPVGRTIDDVNNWARVNMPNYYTKQEEKAGLVEGLGTMNFWADKFANGVGYTVGSMATMWLGVGEGAMLAKMANAGRMGKIAQATDKALDVTQDAAKFGSKQFQAYNAAKVVNAPYAPNFAAGIDDGLTAMARRANIKTAAKHLSVGLHMSLAEASVEARETKNRFIEEQKAKWEEENPGQEMPADVEEGIVASGAAAGNLTFSINLPILATTNMIMFGKMLQTGKPASESLTYGIKKVDGKWIEAIPEKGMARAFAKANRLFGAPIKNSATEAFQEGAQFTASELSRDYYSDKFADGVGDMAESFSKALANTVGTKEGLESMLIGALVGGGTGMLGRLAGADKKFAQEKTANTKKALDILNSGSFAKVLENMENTENNLSLVKDMNEAVQKGEFTEAEKIRRRIISNTANHYRKSGALDYAMEQIDDLKQLDETEFKKRWGYDVNKTLKEQTGMEQAELIDDVKSKMNRSIKRQEQVESIIRAQQPSKAIFSRILDSFETKEIRESKALESSLRNMYANQLLYRLENVDSIDDLIKDKYQELLEKAPALAQVPEEDFDYMVKTGQIEISKDGNVTVKSTVTGKKTDKLNEKLKDILANKFALNPEDSKDFEKTIDGLGRLIMERQAAIQSYNGLRNNPEDLALLVEAEVEKRKLNDTYKKAQQAKSTIENAQSTEELDLALPTGISAEDLALAKIRRRELEEQEDILARGYEKLTDDEFNAIDEDKLSPAEEVAYRRVKRQKDIRDAANSKNIQIESPSPVSTDISYDEVLSDIEARTFGEIMISPDGSAFIINGKSYYNLEDNLLDAIVRDSDGNIQGVRLTDMSTGNVITWRFENVSESSNPEVVEKENAIIDSLSYVILLQASSIRADQTMSPAEAREELEPRVQAALEDAAVREKFEENTEATQTEEELAKNNLSKTAGLTDDQLRVQVETLKADLEEMNELLELERQIAMEAGFTKKEFDADPQIKELREIKKRISQLLNTKIKTLRSRKEAKKRNVLPDTDVNTENVVDETLSESEEDLILAGLEEEIKNLENELAPLTEVAKAYKDIIDGKYGENQDVAGAVVALKDTNKKIGVVKAKITKRRNKINEVNEKRQLEELRQNRDAAERAGQPTEGQDPETKDINPGTATQEQGLAPISVDALELINQQLGMAAEVVREQEQKNIQNNIPVTEIAPQATSVVPTVETTIPVVRTAGESDVRLAKGEFLTNEEHHVVLNEDFMPMPNDLTQTVDGLPIIVDPGILGLPEFAAAGTTITFEVREDTKWWTGQSPTLPEDKHWETVPIYATAINPTTGEKVYIALLQSANPALAPGEQGLDRRDIYNLYKQGLTPTATVITKRYNSSNFSNARTTGGQPVFSPFRPDGGVPTVMYVGIQKGTGKVLRLATPGDTLIPGIESVNFDLSKLTPGQVVFPVRDPNGNPTMVVGNTRNVTPEVVTTVVDSIVKAEIPTASTLETLVGVNQLISEQESGQYDMPSQANEDVIDLKQAEGNNFMLVETLLNGTQLVTFFSQTANAFVRLNMTELKAGLSGGNPRFSFIEIGLNEKGYPAILPIPNDSVNRDDISSRLGEDFKQAMLNKKMQVSQALLTANEAFTSPIDNKTYPSYYDFLTSDTSLSTAREEGVGSNAILTADVITNNHGSVFYDVGLKVSNLSTVEKPTQVEEDLQAKQVAISFDEDYKSALATIEPEAPVSDIERRRQLALKNIWGINKINRRTGESSITFNTRGAKDGIVFEQVSTENEMIDQINAIYDALEEEAATQVAPEETVMEITGPQSTTDTYDILGQAPAPTAKPTQAAAATTNDLLSYVLSRPQSSVDAEAEAEQRAAEEALRNPDLAEMVRRECNS
jgi:hypothetical protein